MHIQPFAVFMPCGSLERGKEMEKNKIIAPKQNSLNDNERLEIARLLLKAGFTVRIGKEKRGNSTVSVIEFWEEKIIDKKERSVI